MICGLLGAQINAASSVHITDPKDIGDANGDIRTVGAHVHGDVLFLTMSVDGNAAPTMEETADGMANRHHYHWIIDSDNNPATGRSNAEYEGDPTGLATPIGVDLVIGIGWQEGRKRGLEIYPALDEDNKISTAFSYNASGNTISAAVPLSVLGLIPGQTISISAFQEGASEEWTADWVESATMVIEGIDAPVAVQTDPVDMADPNGDIRDFGARVIGDHLLLWLSVEGIAGPSLHQTPEGMSERHHYHWLLDTDNNPATGRSNAEYETKPTGVTTPIGAETVIHAGWRNSKAENPEAYDALDEEIVHIANFPVHFGGNTLTAIVPLSALGLIKGQTVTISAFQEGASDEWAVDWMEPAVLELEGPSPTVLTVADPADLPDTSGDIRSIQAYVHGDELQLIMTVEGIPTPTVLETQEGKSNRYHYHWLIDTDNNPATGRSNAEYEGDPTGLENPIGSELVVHVAWQDGLPGDVEVYTALDEAPVLNPISYKASGNSISTTLKLSDLGLTPGQTIAISAFQEGASDGWIIDWVESGELVLDAGIATAQIASVDDPQDIADPSGDMKRIEVTYEGTDLIVRMWVYGTIMPLMEETPEGMANRYYYHWLLDTDNNPATGRSNSEYETKPTGVSNPIGAERVIVIGWRDGTLESREVYDAADDENPTYEDFEYTRNGDMVEARIPFSELGLVPGQTITVSAFEEGASNEWQTDWMESATLTLGAPPSLSLESTFEGNSYGFTIILQDADEAVADDQSAEVLIDGNPIDAEVSKSGGTTTIAGVYQSLLEADSVHEVTVSVDVSGSSESRTFVYQVGSYTVLSGEGKLNTLNSDNSGFLVYLTAIPSWQSGNPDLLEGKATLAEMQLAGQLVDEISQFPYYNEADYDGIEALWKGPGFIEEDVINWFDQAPGLEAPLNFGQDSSLPFDYIGEGIVAEILTYLYLEVGSHKLGLLTEGGHKVSQGFTPSGPVISLFDNSESERIPTYFARNQFFDVVAPEDGYYPIRVLWFQGQRSQEPGMMLEFFSVKGQTLHLVNDPDNPEALKAYRAGVLLTPGVEAPALSVSRDGSNLVLSWSSGTGPFTVQKKSSLDDAQWNDISTTAETSATVPIEGGQGYFRVSGSGNANPQ